LEFQSSNDSGLWIFDTCIQYQASSNVFSLINFQSYVHTKAIMILSKFTYLPKFFLDYFTHLCYI